VVEQADFIARLDEARLRHQGLSIDDFDSFFLQSEQNGQFDDVDADWFFMEAAHFEFDTNLFGNIFRATHFRCHGAAQHGDSSARPFAEPRAM
jgi:hypothetical protein